PHSAAELVQLPLQPLGQLQPVVRVREAHVHLTIHWVLEAGRLISRTRFLDSLWSFHRWFLLVEIGSSGYRCQVLVLQVSRTVAGKSRTQSLHFGVSFQGFAGPSLELLLGGPGGFKRKARRF